MKSISPVIALFFFAVSCPGILSAQTNSPRVNADLRRAGNFLEAAKRYQKDEKKEAACNAVKRAFAVLGQTPGADRERKVMELRWNLAITSGQLGDFEGEREGWEGVISYYDQNNADASRFLWGLRARINLSKAFQRNGWAKEATDLNQEIEALLTKRLAALNAAFKQEKDKLAPAEYEKGLVAVVGVYHEMCKAQVELGKKPLALEQMQEALSLLKGYPGADGSGFVMQIRWRLALLAGKIPDLPSQRSAWQGVIKYYVGIKAEDDPKSLPYLQKARLYLAQVLASNGLFPESLKLHREVIEVGTQMLGPEAKDTQIAWGEMAKTLNRKGDLDEALGIQRKVLAVFKRTLSMDDKELYQAMRDLAASLRDKYSGLNPDIFRLRKAAVIAYERILESTATDLQVARIELASSYTDMRDYVPARRLIEQALTILEKTTLPHEDNLILARQELGVVLQHQGDLVGARAILEEDLKIQLANHPPHSPTVIQARDNLAMTLFFLRDLDGARRNLEEVVKAYEANGCGDHYMILDIKHSLASIYLEEGNYREAKSRFQKVLAGYKRNNDWRVAHGQAELAASIAALGDLKGARKLFAKAFVILGKSRISAHYHNLSFFRRCYALTLAGMKKWGDLAKQLDAILDEGHYLVTQSYATSPREIGETSYLVGCNLDLILSMLHEIPAAKRGDLEARTFVLQETMRCAAIRATGAFSRLQMTPKIKTLREKSQVARQELGSLVAHLAGLEKADPEAKKKIQRAAKRRDQADRKLRLELIKTGFHPLSIEAGKLAAALGDKSAAIAYRRYRHWQLGTVKRYEIKQEERFGAYVLNPQGKLRFLDLGTVEQVRELATAWRAEIGKPVLRSLKAVPGDRNRERRAGVKLRKLVLDPVLAMLPSVTNLHVCLDDALHLVPLAALPAQRGDSRVLGQECLLNYYTSFNDILVQQDLPQGQPRLIAFGDIEYNDIPPPAVPVEATAKVAKLLPIPSLPPVASADRGGFTTLWLPLQETRKEVKNLTHLFRKYHPALQAIEVMGKDATKPRFVELAQEARFLHLATHGYFAGDEVVVSGELNQQRSQSSFSQILVGFSPMSLCGLVFAGVNSKKDPNARSRGILTAEELAGLDLSNCELAVLSACETNVGIRRGGQGLQSMQAALHAAGVRLAITSLWKVNDEVTCDLMHRFYHYLWAEKKPAAAALWAAKSDLFGKKIGSTPIRTRDWAAFILTGDPR